MINCITLETISEALEILKEYDFADQEAVQLTASRSKEIGKYHLMMGENPIYIITCNFTVSTVFCKKRSGNILS